jgi:hypothetical protein
MQRVFMTTDDREHPVFMFDNPAEWIPARMRCHPYPSCLVFAADGELFFAAYGDLWCGEMRTDKIDGTGWLFDSSLPVCLFPNVAGFRKRKNKRRERKAGVLPL